MIQVQGRNVPISRFSLLTDSAKQYCTARAVPAKNGSGGNCRSSAFGSCRCTEMRNVANSREQKLKIRDNENRTVRGYYSSVNLGQGKPSNETFNCLRHK